MTQLSEGAKAALEFIEEGADRGVTLEAIRLGWDYELGKPGVAVAELLRTGAVVEQGPKLVIKTYASRARAPAPPPPEIPRDEPSGELEDDDHQDDQDIDTPPDGTPPTEELAAPAIEDPDMARAKTTHTCETCSKEFKGGARAKWCSPKCKAAAKSKTGGLADARKRRSRRQRSYRQRSDRRRRRPMART